jgi:hypothetical protein
VWVSQRWISIARNRQQPIVEVSICNAQNYTRTLGNDGSAFIQMPTANDGFAGLR